MRFHGFDNPEEELKAHGIDSEDLGYLLASFTLAGSGYNVTDDKAQFLGDDSYRGKMFKTEAMRNAWPLVRRFFGGTSADFKKAMDELYIKSGGSSEAIKEL